jgi:hypothetical protein
MMRTSGFAFALVAAGVAWGCGGGGSSGEPGGGPGSGPSTDFAALHSEYASPTGHFQAGDFAAVAGALAQNQQTSGVPVAASAKVNLGDPGSGTTIQNNPTVTCAPSGGAVVCNCPVSGTITETVASNSGGGGVATLTYTSCVFSSSSSGSVSLDGTLSFENFTTPPPMTIYSGSLSETVTPPGTVTTINLNYALINGVISYTVTVASGTVLVSDTGSWNPSTKSGSFTVSDSSATWNCSLTNGSGTCTGPGGTFPVHA